MKSDEKIQFKGMGDEVPKMEPGDINFIVQEKDHALFKRKGADLLVMKTLSLNQALCGFKVRFCCYFGTFYRNCIANLL